MDKTVEELKRSIRESFDYMKSIEHNPEIWGWRPDFNKMEDCMECFVCKNEVTNEEIKEKKATFIKHEGKEVAVHLKHHGFEDLK